MNRFLLHFLSMIALSSLSVTTVTMANTTPENPQLQLAQKLNCNNAQTQVEINQCAGLSYQNADKKLNQVYKQLLPTLSSSRKQKLITAQQAWIKFRDTSCEFERSQYEGGTIAPSIYLGCLERTTRQRTQQLQDYLNSDN
ncbi:lysozyme inhibitor LprI family protein [Calothrix sp. FACHB-1219]|uniref:lysozyme inhibitor LprI family protein n=1 Tax=unclassified Calothrix TaxID=2619626 RepID=UPI001681DCA4|nr:MULTISPECIES: lysozyme inhibitor LprI family protein [unclassified Calothrix]MBD2204097.1 lysozyme inhibitor LprI family protein [Calothrix sp. FACHB-168]MBD2221270.1 lysozyme inhibitor LprI family protein [Calothrix sp. FACHB-1219]